MPQGNVFRVIVTGEHEGLDVHGVKVAGKMIEVVQLPVLEFEAIPVDPEIIKKLVEKPVNWVVFASARAVRFFGDLLMDLNVDFPMETQVACVGEATAEAAARDGFNADFYPTEPGSEKFLQEFEHLLSNNTVKPSIFIPAAEGGRIAIAGRLKELGCEVTMVPFYKSVPKKGLKGDITPEEVETTDLFVFTSPSSYDAFTGVFTMPPTAKVASMGAFTAQYLAEKGISGAVVVPGSDLSRLGEIVS